MERGGKNEIPKTQTGKNTDAETLKRLGLDPNRFEIVR